MDRLFRNPEAAAQADDRASAVSRIVKVAYAPSGRHAVVFLEYDGSEPYVQLCERTDAGWIATTGGSGDGHGWSSTHEDPVRGVLGVATRWDPPSAQWDVEPPDPGEPGGLTATR
jgi:hypothetical protein